MDPAICDSIQITITLQRTENGALAAALHQAGTVRELDAHSTSCAEAAGRLHFSHMRLFGFRETRAARAVCNERVGLNHAGLLDLVKVQQVPRRHALAQRLLRLVCAMPSALHLGAQHNGGDSP